ncbi:MAG: sodium/solute symporter [Bacteroidales bacterium]|nr:sodium/solute symporter [Bacteroidales bacterium]
MDGVKLGLGLADYIAFIGYFIALFAIGAVVARKKKANASDYFLAGKSLPWYVVGSSYIAANISTEHFIGMIGAAVVYGICVATQEWSTVIAFTFLIWIFIPFLLTSKVYTAPEFLEKRFNRNVRFIFALVTILANIVAFMGPVIYGGGLILVELFEMDPVVAAIVIGFLAGIMAIVGGLKSIAFMDLLTIIVMVIGGLTVTFLGLYHLGDGEGMVRGFGEMVRINLGEEGWAREWIGKNVPNILKSAEVGSEYNRMSVLQPLNHYTNPWTHWVLSFFYIGLWYTAINQHMIQKVFAAKDMYHARMGMVFASFLKLLLPFIVVVPGLIYFAMRPDFLSSDSWNIISDESNKTYIVMINQLVPIFMKGILLAALFGAIQSTVSSVLNSTSTVFTIDFYKEYFKKNATEQEEIKVGRISGTIILAISIGIAIVLATAKVNLFVFIQALYSFIAPPFSAIFLLGMLWRRVNGKDAFITIIASFALSFFLKYLEFGPLAESTSALAGIVKPFAMQALITWIFAMIVCTISAAITPEPDAKQVGDGLVLNFKKLSAIKGGLGTKWYNSVTFWWGLAFAMMFGFIIIFGVIL